LTYLKIISILYRLGSIEWDRIIVTDELDRMKTEVGMALTSQLPGRTETMKASVTITNLQPKNQPGLKTKHEQ
jgi:hypothetical protein